MTAMSPLLFLLVVAGAAVLLVLRVVSRRRRGPAVSGPVCGACGYSVTGLTSLTCPECGSDLRAAGILTPHTAAPFGGFVGSAIKLCVLWLLCLAPLTTLVSAVLPAPKHYVRRVQYSGPSSGLYGGVIASARTTEWGDAPPGRPLNVTVELAPRAVNPMPVSPSRLDVNGSTGGYRYADAAGRQVVREAGFGRGAVVDWFAAAGVDVSKPEVKDEAALVAVAVHRAARIRHPVVGNSGYSDTRTGSALIGPFQSVTETHTGRAQGAGYATILLVAAWVALGAAGLRYLWRMTRASSRH
jgi:hypothetical protein